jgi:hypothetical protein
MRSLRLLVIAGCAALVLTLQASPGTERLTLIGSAAAQEVVDVDYFYDQLESFGEWVWHPRFGYVWIPSEVSEDWRPYTIGHWIYTDEYGWYWESEEPFAWAVYHYGRWGYDPDYGWFWVPGDTWAPAWVQWRYGDQYVGWAPIGPAASGGYAYGAPVSYEPPVAEAWVFVEPRYVAAPDIYRYCVPIPRLNVVFFSATTVYNPEFRGGVVLNYGIPRETIVKITNRPIVAEKIVRVQTQTSIYEKGGEGIKVFAPPVSNGNPQGKPKHFADAPSEVKPKAKLTATVEGAPPKGLGPSAATIRPIATEVRPEDFKKHVKIGGPGQPGGPGEGQANIQGGPNGPGGPGGPGVPGGHKGKFGPGGPGQPGGPGEGQANIQGGPNGPGGPGGPGVPGGHKGKPAVCKQNPDLKECKEKQ